MSPGVAGCGGAGPLLLEPLWGWGCAPEPAPRGRVLCFQLFALAEVVYFGTKASRGESRSAPRAPLVGT